VVIIKRGKGEVWGPRAKICQGPRATLILPWSLVGSSCGFNANCQRSKESTDDSPRRRITGAAPGRLSEIWGPRANYTLVVPVNHSYPPLLRQTFYPLANLYLPAFLELGSRRKLLPCPLLPPCMGGPCAAPLSYHNYLLQIIFKALVFFK
jgi:hypothetical protein